MAEHTTEGISFVDDPTGTLYRRESGMSQPVWCGICTEYGQHDTGHHDTQGGLKPGDIAIVGPKVPVDQTHYVGRTGRVEQVRGKDVTLALPGRRGGTDTVTFHRDHVTLDR